ncbi:endonuclease V [Amycolatopsis sp. La24]|uniref:endonuclease V n=1 Tax=Amycolatopsis sp. La24 TaxID=3028304 RepID=UPI0031B63CDE
MPVTRKIVTPRTLPFSPPVRQRFSASLPASSCGNQQDEADEQAEQRAGSTRAGWVWPSHLGVLTGLPTAGVAKTPFTFSYNQPGPLRGDWSPLLDGTEVVGRALRTRPDVKPVFVSVGHRIGLAEACDATLALAPEYRLPETTRRADSLCRRALAEALRGEA